MFFDLVAKWIMNNEKPLSSNSSSTRQHLTVWVAQWPSRAKEEFSNWLQQQILVISKRKSKNNYYLNAHFENVELLIDTGQLVYSRIFITGSLSCFVCGLPLVRYVWCYNKVKFFHIKVRTKQKARL